MKRCELCKGKARMHCESDQASLCWDCDAKVHSANFLVARHSRNLLCHVCQSPTPWTASGAKLGPALSFCEQCVNRRRGDENGEEEAQGKQEDEVVEENQVVPWSPPPAEESSSSSEESVGGGEVVVSRKRCGFANASPNLHPEEDEGCASSQLNIRTPPSNPTAAETARIADSTSRRKTMRPRKNQRTESGRVEVCGSGMFRTFHQEEASSGEEMAEICTFPGPSI